MQFATDLLSADYLICCVLTTGCCVVGGPAGAPLPTVPTVPTVPQQTFSRQQRTPMAAAQASIIDVPAALSVSETMNDNLATNSTQLTQAIEQVEIEIAGEREQPVDRESLYNCLKEHPGFGLATIIKYHFTSKDDKALRITGVAALLLLLGQIAVPVVLLLHSRRSVGRCETHAPIKQRALVSFIAMIYAARTTVLQLQLRVIVDNLANRELPPCYTWIVNSFPYNAASVYGNVEVAGEVKRNERPIEWKRLQTTEFNHTTARLDMAMNTTYEQLVYLLNLWLVFTEPDIQDMILNALALEFIMKLDDEFVALYWKTSGAAADEIYNDLMSGKHVSPGPSIGLLDVRRGNTTESHRSLWGCMTFVLKIVQIFVEVGSWIGVIIFIGLGPACKPAQ
jgi:hypothetical protein